MDDIIKNVLIDIIIYNIKKIDFCKEMIIYIY